MKKERKKKFLSSRTPSGVQSELKTCTLISLSVPSPPLFCFVARFIRSIINERESERIEGGVGDGKGKDFSSPDIRDIDRATPREETARNI